MFALFKDRHEAGRMLADRLRNEAGARTVVLGLPRGGVPVAFEVALALRAELDVLPVRKIGVPGHSELAMGAIASGGALHVEHDTMEAAQVTQAQFDAVLARERAELERRERAYRGNRAPAPIEGRTVLLVDDGIATGSTMKAAILALRARHPARVVAALPVAPAGIETEFSSLVDAFVCLAQPTLFFSVGQHYEDFGETTDDDVRALLQRAWGGENGPTR
ncbi:phosphoribosyl transferase [Trinickia dabaoshanensis]|uniref:Phosphoribosyl transferase n=1 Tax=Trinickia dabaoshanensis TaxID=564714 RepID=A0A2N7VGR0_9BURK|nr:phosphoribosyltransferase family protein [Trinickia dabaoshanensis]PMS16343.1 phosphoribosyl transferase [Trinickia dabaoshanensis]